MPRGGSGSTESNTRWRRQLVRDPEEIVDDTPHKPDHDPMMPGDKGDMRPANDFKDDRLVPPGRAIWIALIATSGVCLSSVFACATPFAALAALAALKLGRRDTIAVPGLVWLANQVIGYGFLGYPWTWVSLAWGLAIGGSTALAVVAAAALSTARPAPLAVSLPFVAAFTAFELGLYVTGFVLPGSDGAFSAAVIGHVFLINAVTLCCLMAAYHLAMLVGQLSRHHASVPIGAGGASLR
jgi:hypothetical protein